MTYEKIFDLKYNKGLSTYDLVRQFPEHIQRVSEIALLEVPDNTLEEILSERKVLVRLKKLKKRLFKRQVAAG